MTDAKLARLEMLVGEAGLARLREAHVAICGLGAVGSYALEGLVRAGVGRFRLADHDEIRPTNFNRQLLALDSTLGLPKVEAARRRVLDIRPECEVEAIRAFVHVESLERILAGPPDVVLDAIDALGPKAELIAAAVRRRIPIVSSMGAALRTDPMRVRVGPLAASCRCPMARRVRRRLKKLGVPLDFLCVWSDETTAGLPEEALGDADSDTEEAYRRGRQRRPLGSLPTLTGIFGLMAANAALRIILGDRFPGESPGKPPGC